jgi:hypothetical protein
MHVIVLEHTSQLSGQAVVVVVVVVGQAMGFISGLDLQLFTTHHALAKSLAQPQVMSVRLANPCVPK